MSWQTEDFGHYVEVKPVNDIKEHYAGDECWCMPERIDQDGERPVISHNSLSEEQEQILPELIQALTAYITKARINELKKLYKATKEYVYADIDSYLKDRITELNQQLKEQE